MLVIFLYRTIVTIFVFFFYLPSDGISTIRRTVFF